ncbi:MAG: hypothetical protein WDZ60_09705, partial [Wenzhouxiangellaceae bacterium]
RLTIGNPNPVVVGGYRFTDNLPGNMVVANPANASSSCGGTLTATSGSGVIDFDGGIIDANSSCTILVDVTVPFDPGATYPLALNNSVDLFVGDAPDPSATAQATLNVTEEPPPPLTCTILAAGTDVALWNSFNDDLAPTPSFEFAPGIASAQGGPGLTFDRSNDLVEWRARAQITGQTLAAARLTDAYYEFRLDTTGLVSVDLSLEAFRRNGNAPDSITLDYGPVGGSLVQSTTFSPVPTQNSRPGTANFFATGLTNLNPNGETVFRVFAYGASNANQPTSLLDILFEAEGEICSPTTPGDEPDPPILSKAFSPNPVQVGQASTLTFTIENPNPADALSEITFRDEFPAGMEAVTGTFVNSCNAGSSWGLEGVDPAIVLFSEGTLAGGASCTLEVDVRSTTVGSNFNVSDPVNALETFAGNSAIDQLEVLPPPAPPSIAKFFDPNPLFDANGSTTLVFQLTNNDPTLNITSVVFSDVLPLVGSAQMQPVTTSPLDFTDNGQCGAGFNFTWDTPTSTLALTNGEITAGQVCEIAVEVEVPGLDPLNDLPVQFPNQTSTVSHIFNGLVFEGNQAEATLLVDNPIPGIRLLKQVGLTTDPDGVWSDYMAVPVNTDVFYKLTVENIGETELSTIAVADPTINITSCTWPASLPVADFNDPDGHI